jgi:hypothetical protein
MMANMIPAGKDWPGEWERIPSGVDVTLIEENLRLTPTERVEKMLRLLRLVEEIRKECAGRQTDHPDSG